MDTYAGQYIGRRLLPDVCSCCVLRNASVSLARAGLPINFSFKTLDLSILKKLHTETHVCRTTDMFIIYVLFIRYSAYSFHL